MHREDPVTSLLSPFPELADWIGVGYQIAPFPHGLLWGKMNWANLILLKILIWEIREIQCELKLKEGHKLT